MYIRDIIDKKRRKKELTEEEIRFYVFSYFKEEISEAQAAALMTAMHIYGLSEKEMIYMVKAAAETGEELEFYRECNKVTDISSLGGISDKIILMLICILHSLGIKAFKVIGRELGMEDRLICIQGYELEDDIEKFRNSLKKEEIGILKSIKNLAPVEKKMYKLRHDISCDNNMQLIAISIMSQKIALGFRNMFFEITYGENAYVKTLDDAKLLSQYLVNIGKKLMRNVGCCVTKLNQPTGKTFGNILELKEIYDALNGNMPNDIEERILEFASHILNISNISKDSHENKKRIKEVIKNGKALESFKVLINNRGGKIEFLESDIKVKNIIPVTSSKTGYISEIDINKLRMLSKYLNAIRGNEKDELDVGAGIILNKKVGECISTGGILAYIYTNNDTKIQKAVEQVREIFKISDKRIKKSSNIVFKN